MPYGDRTARACLASAAAYGQVDPRAAQAFTDPLTDAQAALEMQHDTNGSKVAVVAFRGSSSAMDWIHNVLVPMRRVPTHKRSVRAHSGFLGQYMSLHSDLSAAIAKGAPDHIVFCGHSLGGALACIATAMSTHPVGCTLVTFGAPRPGNAGLAAVTSQRCERCVRVVHDRDVVPSAPLRTLGYTHVVQPWLSLDEAGRTHAQATERSLTEEIWLRLCGVMSLDFGVADHLMDRYLRGVPHSYGAAPARPQPVQVHKPEAGSGQGTQSAAATQQTASQPEDGKAHSQQVVQEESATQDEAETQEQSDSPTDTEAKTEPEPEPEKEPEQEPEKQPEAEATDKPEEEPEPEAEATDEPGAEPEPEADAKGDPDNEKAANGNAKLT